MERKQVSDYLIISKHFFFFSAVWTDNKYERSLGENIQEDNKNTKYLVDDDLWANQLEKQKDLYSLLIQIFKTKSQELVLLLICDV